MRRLAAIAALLFALAGLGAATAATAPAANAAVMAPQISSATLGDRVLNKAITKYRHYYSYGAAGPTYFDCSGLVYWSAKQLGISVPRTTGGMLAGSAHLYRISLSSIRRGDLVFYGSGHVEINTAWYHTSFGAHSSSNPLIGWRGWNGYYAPTMAMRFR
jgi:cell wall-associated NlpC family hydrolase